MKPQHSINQLIGERKNTNKKGRKKIALIRLTRFALDRLFLQLSNLQHDMNAKSR